MSKPDNTTFYGLDHVMESGTAIGDVLIRGRKLRDFQPDEFISYDDAVNWTMAVFDAIPLGNDLDQLISDDFRQAFYKHRNSFIHAEQRLKRAEEQKKLIHTLLGDLADYEVLGTIEVAHVGWEMDNHYTVVRHWGLVKYIGTDHGGARLFDRAHIEALLADVERQRTELQAALAF